MVLKDILVHAAYRSGSAYIDRIPTRHISSIRYRWHSMAYHNTTYDIHQYTVEYLYTSTLYFSITTYLKVQVPPTAISRWLYQYGTYTGDAKYLQEFVAFMITSLFRHQLSVVLRETCMYAYVYMKGCRGLLNHPSQALLKRYSHTQIKSAKEINFIISFLR